MSTVMASYTTAVRVSRSPALQQASSLLLARGSWRPAVGLRPCATVNVRRRALTMTCALPEKERPPAFSIPPTALLCPVPPPDGKERWDIKEEDDHVTLWLQVPGLSASDIEVTTGEDVLDIKRRVTAQQPAPVDAHGVGAFHIRLLLTKEYDGSSVTADLKAGMLEVTVPKNSQRPGERVVLGAARPTPTPTSTPHTPPPPPPPPPPTPTPTPTSRGNESSTRKGAPQPQPQETPGRQNTNG